MQQAREDDRIARAVGYGSLVRWDAVHFVEPPNRLWWYSTSGISNGGEAIFEAVEAAERTPTTRVTLKMTYTLPNIAAPFLENKFAQRFVRRNVMRTMERYRDALEAETAAAAAREE